MRKRIGHLVQEEPVAQPSWLPVEVISEVEVTSEGKTCPIESALIPNQGISWRAAEAGKQTIRLHFDPPQPLHRIWMNLWRPPMPARRSTCCDGRPMVDSRSGILCASSGTSALLGPSAK
jgi:hypothetical protein